VKALIPLLLAGLLAPLGTQSAVAAPGALSDSSGTASGSVAAPGAPVATPDTTLAPSDTSATAVPQRDAFDVLNEHVLHRRMEPEVAGTTRTGLSWAVLPTVNYNPVYGFAVGAMVTGAGQRGTRTKRYSQLSVSANYSTMGQIQAQVRGDVFDKSGDYLLRMDFRYLDTERSTWGLGPMTSNQQEYPMDFKLQRTYATLYRRASGPVFIGIGYHYDEFNDIVDQRAEQGEETPFTAYSGGDLGRTIAAGVSINVLGDTRDNLVNPSSGYYLSASFRDYDNDFGSDDNWQEMWAEMRVYPHLPDRSRNVLAFWLYSWLTFGKAPYLNLPANGWDTYGRGARGYLQGRIRGPNQVYLECEYRRTLTANGLWGAVAFLNSTVTTDPDSEVFGRADFGGGGGIRLKFNKNSNTNLAVDFGWGHEGSKGVFFGMSEVF
jgi:hypothetical protein